MDTAFYLNQFREAADRLDKELLNKKQIELWVGVVLNSFCLKLYKKSWANPSEDALTARSRIFFSVWAGDPDIGKRQIRYNIHALKLRHLEGHSIQSRKFADVFRERFTNYTHKWPNVSVDFGPLTLMEGWIQIDAENAQDRIVELACNFLEIEHLLDDALASFRK